MTRTRALAAFATTLVLGAGCTEVKGRRRAQQGNELYKEGKYEEADAKFAEAAELIPEFPTLWLNKGFNCGKMIAPGSKGSESKKAAECALAAFEKFKVLQPDDPRGEQLYIQTLFDAEHFETLEKMFKERHDKKPCDKEAIATLQQVYARWDKFEESLDWYKKAADCEPTVAERHYSVGVFIWQKLFAKGGAADMATYDPRPYALEMEKYKGKTPPAGTVAPAPPVPGVGSIVSQQRIDMADLGIQYLEKAIAIRPKYNEAMTYVNLLYRQKSFAYFDDIPKWQESVDKAKEWLDKSLALLRAAQGAAAKGDGGAEVQSGDAGAPGSGKDGG